MSDELLTSLLQELSSAHTIEHIQSTIQQAAPLLTDKQIKALEALGCSILEHMSALEQKSAQLDALSAELEAFTYSISHDLRSPITIVNGLSQMIQCDKNNVITQDSHYLFTRLDSNIKRMNGLLDDLLMLSKISQSVMNQQEIDVTTMAQELIAEQQINQPDRLINCSIAPSLKVTGDPKLIRTLLGILLNNSLKFTSKNINANITVGCFAQENREGIFIKDNGCGFKIPTETGELFRPFKRYHSDENYPGRGIGLALAQRIIRLHQGALWPESSPDQGATFYFYLNKVK